MTNTITLPTAELLKTDTAQDLKDSEEAANFVNSIIVSTNENLLSATRILAEIKTKYKQIEQKKKDILNPLSEAQKNINKFFKPALDALKKAEDQIKGKVSDCIEERMRNRDEILNDIENIPENKRDSLLTRAEDLIPPKIDGLSIINQWTGELQSNQQVVQWAIDNQRFELLNANVDALLAITKSCNRDPTIPGWRAFKKSVVRITAGNVK